MPPLRTLLPKTLKLTAVDLFSGCGGLSTGLKKAHFRILGAIDNDRTSVSAYKANHPEVHVWQRNITQLSAVRVRRELGLRPGQLEVPPEIP